MADKKESRTPVADAIDGAIERLKAIPQPFDQVIKAEPVAPKSPTNRPER